MADLVIGIATATRQPSVLIDGTIAMTTHAATLLAPTSARAHVRDHSRPMAPILIRVPALTSRSRKPARPVVGRVKRRIRSEIRVASLTLLFAMPLSWALFSLAQIGPAQASDSSRATASASQSEVAATDDPPLATIGLTISEPTAPEAEVPTVTPAGYLVPDDGPEEMVHAGP